MRSSATRALALVVVVGVVLGIAEGARAQRGVLYHLEIGSGIRQDRCLEPCLCPPHSVSGALTGTFTLARREVGPVFTTYRLTAIQWAGTIAREPVTVTGAGAYMVGGPAAAALMQQMDLVLVASSPAADPVVYSSALVSVEPVFPLPLVSIAIQGAQQGCSQNTIKVVASPWPCQADCDYSGGLSGNDFACFLNRFASGDPFANCDGSAGMPMLTANDFMCYVNRYASGCT